MTLIITGNGLEPVILTTQDQYIYIKGSGAIREVVSDTVEALKLTTKNIKPNLLLNTINEVCKSNGWVLVAY